MKDYTLREMRDWVFGQRSTANNWDHCKEKWEEDRTWLLLTFADLPRPLTMYENLPWPKEK